MTLLPSTSTLILFLCALIGTPLLATVARRLGLKDLRAPGERERKPREAAVPPIGGGVLMLGLLACEWSGVLESRFALPWPALGVAFGLGLVDDLRSLGPGSKLAGQVLVGLLLGLELATGAGGVCLYICAAVIACNAANTFDNADGALAGTSLLFLHTLPPVQALVAGFLPSNLFWRRGKERVPLAYLGDSGSHMIGVLLLLTPAGLFALALPLLDLLRLSRLRLRTGSRPWVGDRRHLAHRLEQRFSPVPVAGLLALIAAPGAVGCGLVLSREGQGLAAVMGSLATALLFWIAIRSTRDPVSPAGNLPLVSQTEAPTLSQPGDSRLAPSLPGVDNPRAEPAGPPGDVRR